MRWLILLALAGCTQTIHAPTYRAATIESLSGAVSSGPFTYAPREDVTQREIYFPMAASFELAEPVPAYLQRAIALELHQAGLGGGDGAGCSLAGQMTDLRISHATGAYSAEVTYSLEVDGSSAYRRTVANTVSNASYHSDAVIGEYLNRLISESVGQVLSDPAFRVAIDGHCHG